MIGRFLALLCVPLALSAEGHWVEARSGPFHVFSDEGDRPAREQLVLLEQFRHALGVTLEKDDLRTIWPVRVVLLKNAKQAPPPPPIALGRDAYMILGPLDTEGWRALARLLMDQNINGLPTEVERGLAELFSTLTVSGAKVTLGAPPPPAARTRDWARMHLLLVSPEYGGRSRVFLSNLTQLPDLDFAYRNAFEKAAAQIEKQVDQYLAAGNFGTTDVSGLPINPAHDLRLTDADPEDTRPLLPDLLLAANSPRAEAAYNALQGAVAAEGLGLVALAQSRTNPAKTAEAMRLFSSAIDAGTKNARIYSELGRLEPDKKKAWTDLAKAAELNPHWDEPAYQLALIEPDLDRKSILLKKACSLAPRNMTYWRALAENETAANRYGEVQKAWAGAERAAASPEEREQIRKTKLEVENQRADYIEAERKRIAEEEARDRERVKNASMAEIHAAEEAAHKKLNPEGSKPVSQPPVEWSDVDATAKADGSLQRLECLGRLARLVIAANDGKTIQLAVRDPSLIVLTGGGVSTLPCGPWKPARKVTVSYAPKIDKKLNTTGDAVVIEFH